MITVLRVWPILIAVVWIVQGWRTARRGETTIRWRAFLWERRRLIAGPAVALWGAGIVLLGVVVITFSLLTFLYSTGTAEEMANLQALGTIGLAFAYMVIMLPICVVVHVVTRGSTKIKRKPKVKHGGMVEDAELEV